MSNKCVEIEQCSDSDLIAAKFASHFCSAYTANNADTAESLYNQYAAARIGYCGFPVTDAHTIDTELVSSVIARLARGEATDATGLSAKRLIHSRPSISVALAKLFRLIMLHRYVPARFRYSYMIPVPKLKDCTTKSVNCDDFRRITISTILSKVFEHCILDRFGASFVSCEAQFGFKKNSGCRTAIYSLRKIVDRLTKDNSTVNICSLDLSKAFDKVNQFRLYIKLMKGFIPVIFNQLTFNLFFDLF